MTLGQLPEPRTEDFRRSHDSDEEGGHEHAHKSKKVFAGVLVMDAPLVVSSC